MKEGGHSMLFSLFEIVSELGRELKSQSHNNIVGCLDVIRIHPFLCSIFSFSEHWFLERKAKRDFPTLLLTFCDAFPGWINAILNESLRLMRTISGYPQILIVSESEGHVKTRESSPYKIALIPPPSLWTCQNRQGNSTIIWDFPFRIQMLDVSSRTTSLQNYDVYNNNFSVDKPRPLRFGWHHSDDIIWSLIFDLFTGLPPHG